jgi:hypothetical protein
MWPNHGGKQGIDSCPHKQIFVYVLEARFDKDFKSLDVNVEGLKTLYIKKAGMGTRTQDVQGK